MQRIHSFEDLFEAKLKRKSASADLVHYPSLLELPVYAELKKMGLFMPPKEDATFRATGMIQFRMAPNSILITSPEIRTRIAEWDATPKEERRDDILSVVADKQGSIYIKGILVGWRTLRVRGRRLDNLEDYSEVMHMIKNEVEQLARDIEGWSFAGDSSTEEARDQNRVDNVTIEAMDDLW